jgi:low temperature requirement protein LtrA
LSAKLLRQRGAAREAHVTNMELFFDLVFVFAIIQLSTHLEADLSWLGAGETAVMGLALWWAWNYTAWATGWIDPEQTPVMVMMGTLMLLSLVMAAAIPDAFVKQGADRGVAFALAYVALQLLRSGVMVWAFARDRDAVMERNYAQLLAWSAIAGAVWITGACVTQNADLRLVIWLAAALIDLGAPMHGYWLPGRGATPMSDWSLAGAHLAERCQLLLMIAFGETVLRLGESFAEAHEHPNVVLAFVLGFLTSFALWAIYFTHHAEHAAERIHRAEGDAARIGRSGYAYAHMLMVAGVIVLAVAEHLAVLHPHAHVQWSFVLVCVAGPGLYLSGIIWSKAALGHGRVSSPLVGCLALAVLAVAARPFDRLEELSVMLLVAAVLAVLAERDGRRSHSS